MRIFITNKKKIIGLVVLVGTILLATLAVFQPNNKTLSCIYNPSTSQPQATIQGSIISLKKLHEAFFIDYHNMFSHVVREAFESPRHITIEYTIRSLRRIIRQTNENKTLYYCIFDNHDNRLIGGIEIREYNEHDNGQLGFWLNENYWGGGRAQEALQLITNAYFAKYPQLKSYIAHVRPWNKRSFYALKKFGFIDLGYKEQSNRHIMQYNKPA